MNRRPNTLVTRPALALAMTLGLLTGCGQKGDLYLPPTDVHQAQAKPAKTETMKSNSTEPAIQYLAAVR